MQAWLFSYWPISTHWSLKANPEAVNIDFQAFLLTHASLDLVLDIVILCLPIPIITTLHMETGRKIALIGIFWLGALYANDATNHLLLRLIRVQLLCRRSRAD